MIIEVPHDPIIEFTYFLNRLEPPLTYSNDLFAYNTPERFLNEQVKLVTQRNGEYLVAIDYLADNYTESLTIRTTDFKLAHFYFHGLCSRKHIMLEEVEANFPELFI